MMHAVLDVGANNGAWGIEVARRFPDRHVFAFEPTPELVAHITARVRQEGLSNYTLVPKAVSDIPGRLKFHVAGQADWGCSSLLEFSDGLDASWPGRSDFKVTDVIEVDAIRLDAFIAGHGITAIDYLHCDTQGVDLRVLASLGEAMPIVARGEIETASSRGVALYKGQHTIEDVVIFFLQHGLEIERMVANDVHGNELNVSFRRRAV